MVSDTFTQEIAQLHAHICSGLADPHRILILYALQEKPSNVSDLASEIGISQPNASRHLHILRERGMVFAKREGKSVIYTLSNMRIIQALDLLRSVLAEQLNNQAELAQSVSISFDE